MRYVVDAAEPGRAIADIARAGSTTDLETGGASEGEEEVATPQPLGTAAQAHDDPIDAFLRKQRDTTTAPAPIPAAPAPPPPPQFKIPLHGIW